jgi:hypothetical protein
MIENNIANVKRLVKHMVDNMSIEELRRQVAGQLLADYTADAQQFNQNWLEVFGNRGLWPHDPSQG